MSPPELDGQLADIQREAAANWPMLPPPTLQPHAHHALHANVLPLQSSHFSDSDAAPPPESVGLLALSVNSDEEESDLDERDRQREMARGPVRRLSQGGDSDSEHPGFIMRTVRQISVRWQR
jgi:hypothetical protein